MRDKNSSFQKIIYSNNVNKQWKTMYKNIVKRKSIYIFKLSYNYRHNYKKNQFLLYVHKGKLCYHTKQN